MRIRAAAIAVVVCLVFGASACSGDEDPRSRMTETTTTTSAPKQLVSPEDLAAPQNKLSFAGALTDAIAGTKGSADPEALGALAIGPVAWDFIGLIDDVRKADYSVGYKAEGALLAQALAGTGDLASQVPLGDLAFTIVQSASAKKIKNGFVANADVQAEIIDEGARTVLCSKLGSWTCTVPKEEQKVVGAESLLLALGLVAENPGAFDISTYDGQIIGVPVRCVKAVPVTNDPKFGLIEECITGEGVPLRVTLPGLTLNGVWYQPAVAPGAFTLPAPVV